MLDGARGRSIGKHEPHPIPWFDLVVGFGPTLPVAVGAASAWWLNGKPLDYLVALFTLLYAASILLFLAGATYRGTGFGAAGSPWLSRFVAMLVLYGLGLASLFAAVIGKAVPALAMLIVGFSAATALGPSAAPSGQAPPVSARLRLFQMSIAIGGLTVLLGLKLAAPY